jgi:dihydroorotate dehydrogenase (NAD+) catalytic subunit
MFRQDLYLEPPWMNAAGMLGFAPPARWPIAEPFGAFVTNPISLNRRTPAAECSLLSFPGGALLHSGLPNPGLSRVIRKYGERWQQSSLPIWVHLIGTTPDDVHRMVQRLEGCEGVMAVELGLPPDAQGEEALAFIEAAYGELPLVAHLPLTAAREAWLGELAGMGVSAISLGAPRGMLLKTSAGQVHGRLYGPALFPLMMEAVQTTQHLGIPIIAGAGIYHRKDVLALRSAGAWAVQLDTVLWRGWVEEQV